MSKMPTVAVLLQRVAVMPMAVVEATAMAVMGALAKAAVEEAVLVVMVVPTAAVPAVMVVLAVAAVQAVLAMAVTAGFCQAGTVALAVPVVLEVRQPAQTQVRSMFQTRHRELRWTNRSSNFSFFYLDGEYFFS
jgi:hypothetical protein